MRSMGILVYPDGSMAKIFEVNYHPMQGSERVFLPTKRRPEALFIVRI